MFTSIIATWSVTNDFLIVNQKLCYFVLVLDELLRNIQHEPQGMQFVTLLG